jgi:hypothetical protein
MATKGTWLRAMANQIKVSGDELLGRDNFGRWAMGTFKG